MTATPIQTGAQVLDPPTAEEQALPTNRQALGLTIRNAAQLPAEQWPDERISAIKAYVGKEAKTIGELAAFLATCQRYSLDPMVGQLFLIKSETGPKVTTGRDTWLALARREAGYEGIQFGVVHAKDEFGHSRREDGRIVVHHKVLGVNKAQRGELAGWYCVVRDKLLGDNIEVRELADFAHLLAKKNWTYRADMGENRCIAAVLRKHYGFPGLLIQGEEDDVLIDDTARAMPPVDVPTGGPGGAGESLADAVRKAKEARTEDAVDVVIEQPTENVETGGPPVEKPAPAETKPPEPETIPPIPETKPPETGTAKRLPEVEDRLAAERSAREQGQKMKDYKAWVRLHDRGRARTEMEDIRYQDLNTTYPEFLRDHGRDENETEKPS